MWHCSAGWICEVCCECLFQFEKLAETTDKEAGSAEREEDCNSSVSSQLSGMCLDIPVQTKYTNANCYECFYSFLLCVNVHVFTKVCGWRGKKSFFPLRSHCVSIYTVSQKTVRIVFGITLSNFHQLWWFLAKKTKLILLCKVHSFATSPNLCQCTIVSAPTLWNTDAANCYIMQRLFVSDGSPLHHQFDRGCDMV